jgi:hypothetical protein
LGDAGENAVRDAVKDRSGFELMLRVSTARNFE